MISPEAYIQSVLPAGLSGRVTRVTGLTIAVAGFPAPLGAVCRVDSESGETTEGEVIGFQNGETLLLSYGSLSGIRQGNRVTLVQSVPSVRVGERLLGRVINGRGEFIDRLPAALLPHRVRLHSQPISPLDRPRIDEPLTTGVRVIDGLLTCGKGQRLGLFSGSGVGKSTLLGQMARSSSADVNVVVLVGERGREVREFLERDLGPEGLARSVVIVATSDEPALIRLRAAYLGTAIAEFFRDQRKDVLLMMDSVTRFALAQREIGLSAGEPPTTRGYPPSVFSILPRLLERSGRTDQGSITGFYTVLVEGDDTNEPISDTVRGILDGHVMLSRTLAHRSHWPAVDPLASISRSMNDIATPEHIASANNIKQLLAAYHEAEDMISIGAYQRGSNPTVDAAIQMKDSIDNFLQQGAHETSQITETINDLTNLSHKRESLTLKPEEPPVEAVA